MNQPQQPRRQGNPGPILSLFAACGLIDLFGPGVLAGSGPDGLIPMLPGAIAAQPGLLAIWAVLGPQRLLVRWSLSLLVAALLWCVLLWGMIVADLSGGELRNFARGTLMLPLIFLAVQLPLWILRLATGWHLVVGQTSDGPSSVQSRQFGLQHILGATTVIAVALGLARLGLPELGMADGGGDPYAWLSLMFACLMCGVWSAFSTVPCLWAALIARNKAASALIIAVYTVLMSLLVVAVMAVIEGGFVPFGEAAWIVCRVHGGLVLMLLGGLHVARLSGYALRRPGRMRPPPVPAGSSPLAEWNDPFAPPSD